MGGRFQLSAPNDLNGDVMGISLIVGFTIALSTGLYFKCFLGLGPPLLFKLFLLLHLPGWIIRALIFSKIIPQKASQAIYLGPPYNYVAYIGDFVFYFVLTYLIRLIVVKFRKRTLLKTE